MSIITTLAELDALYGVPAEASTIKEVDRVTPHYRALIGDASALVMNFVSRDLDRAKFPLPHAAE